jgi:hypothetical protein
MPDIDQRQTRWHVDRTGQTQWTHDGPVAVANALWWLDSAHEPLAVPPPAVSDGFPLVHTYGPWDDHDPVNVFSLVTDLATLVEAKGGSGILSTGTCLTDLAGGLRQRLDTLGLGPDATTVIDLPTLRQLRDAIAHNQPGVLLLGFWQQHPTAGWRRIGGHYVTLEAVDPLVGRVRLSDPFLDVAAPAESTSAHNDAGRVSHDAWVASPSLRPGAPLRLDAYVDALGDPAPLLGAFQGLNARTCPGADAPWIDGAVIEADIDAVLLIDIRPPTPTPCPPPTDPPPTTPISEPTATATATDTPWAPGSPTPPGAPSGTPSPVPPPGTSVVSPTPPPTFPPTSPPAVPTEVATATPTSTPDDATAVPPAGTDTPPATSRRGSLCGLVVDRRRGAGLPGATVSLQQDTALLGTVTAASGGAFCFDDLPVGRYRIRAWSPGCDGAEEDVDLRGRTSVELLLACVPPVAYLPYLARTAGAR